MSMAITIESRHGLMQIRYMRLSRERCYVRFKGASGMRRARRHHSCYGVFVNKKSALSLRLEMTDFMDADTIRLSDGSTFLDSPAEVNLPLGALLVTLKRRRPRARRLVD